ncbi:MAG: hypothetical protein L6R48_10780, partial [Planctomycetes bacterium]|nr:hypothetical protein [Planctomycetota bacterium]
RRRRPPRRRGPAGRRRRGAPAPGGALPPLPRAGVVLVESAAGNAVVAVSADAGEGDPARVGGGRLPALGAQPHRVADWHGADAMVADWQARRTGLDLMPLVLALAVALFAAETWLANRSLLPAVDGRRLMGGGPAASRASGSSSTTNHQPSAGGTP